ncbi:uncharacterized protein BDW47DRAFT_103286, partial [Aspergillus candidus]
MTRKNTRSKVFNPRLGPKKCWILWSQEGVDWKSLSTAPAFCEDAIRAKVARQKRFPIWSSKLRNILVSSNWRLDIISDGISHSARGHVCNEAVSWYTGPMLSAHGASLTKEISLVMNGARRAGTMKLSGTGDDSMALDVEIYWNSPSSMAFCRNRSN